MKSVSLIPILLLLFSGLLRAGEKDVSDILQRLDSVLSSQNTFRKQKDAHIQKLEGRLNKTTVESERYVLCKELFQEYLHYQADTAVYYLDILDDMPLMPAYPNQKEGIAINRAQVMGVMGMYSEAIRQLEGINSAGLTEDLRREYYHAFRSCYGWLSDYTLYQRDKREYQKKTDQYRDSILLTSAWESDREIVRAEKAIIQGRPDDAIPILQKQLEETTDRELLSYLNFTMYEVYEAKGDMDKQIYYLAQTAIWDAKRVVREYASLQKLAYLLYKKGDVERAYRYLNRSMEDAVNCNARLRSLEVTEVYPIIDRSYREKEQQKRDAVRNMLCSISVLALLLVVAVCYLYYWMKKLSAMRKYLYRTNRKLVAANTTLEEVGKIKDVYIARYLDRCVEYLEKLEQYRRSLEKLAMASKMDELFKAIRSDQFLRDERKAFYREFDKSFLELFPNFIGNFNNLLVEDARIYPKPGELLNTELRIFALIRLGVTDSARIAHFLSYSLTTVYNYRSKIRNRAAGNKDTFEQEVMKL